MTRFINLRVDLDELPRVIMDSAIVCLKAHGIVLSKERIQELGRNVAGSIAMAFDNEAYEERLELWAHIVSEHCNAAPPGSLISMLEYHDHEHNDPGTVRNHQKNSRHYSISKIAEVLSEVEDEVA